MEIRVRNVEEAFQAGINLIRGPYSREEDSRNGRVRVLQEPVMTVYQFPIERILFNLARDANPYFHLMEAMWMLCGRNDVEFLKRYNSRMGQYSDDGKTLYGAYGYRWKYYFGFDQLDEIIRQLKKDPFSRRCVLEMWQWIDLLRETKDKPCNTHCYFRVNEGRLDMTVLCRSNDIIWGAYGANAVHFSILQEYVAAGVGVPMGRMYQFSNNYHAYIDVLNRQDRVFMPINSYDIKGCTPTPIVTDFWSFMKELREVLHQIELLPVGFHEMYAWKNSFMNILSMMAISWYHYKNKNLDKAVQWAERMPCGDWRIACTEWMKRRQING